MTTPRAQLDDILWIIRHTNNLLEPDDDKDSIFTQIDRIDNEMSILKEKLERIENQMALIIKLLEKYE